VRVDTFEPGDVKAAMTVTSRWEYTEDEVEQLLAWSRGSSVLAWDGDEVVGMTLGIPCGTVGWIGSVRVAKQRRGAGLGAKLVEACIERLHAAGASTIKLYSTPKAIKLYERLGFVGEAEFIVAMGSHRRGRDTNVVALADHVDEAVDLDATSFAGDRSRIVRDIAKAYPDLAVATLDEEGALTGFGLARPSEPAGIGPIVVLDGDAHTAQHIVDALLTRVPEGEVEVGYPARSHAAKTCWECRGFVTVNTPLEMRLGPPVEQHRERIVAIGGQELG